MKEGRTALIYNAVVTQMILQLLLTVCKYIDVCETPAGPYNNSSLASTSVYESIQCDLEELLCAAAATRIV